MLENHFVNEAIFNQCVFLSDYVSQVIKMRLPVGKPGLVFPM